MSASVRSVCRRRKRRRYRAVRKLPTARFADRATNYRARRNLRKRNGDIIEINRPNDNTRADPHERR